MKKLILCSGLALALTACGNNAETNNSNDTSVDTETTAQAHVKYSAESFFATTSFGSTRGSVAFNADSTAVLISSDESGIINTYSVDLASGARTQLTFSEGPATYPIGFFPADGRVMYTADGGGDELNHIYVRGEDGTVTDLTPGDKLKANFMGWASDKAHFFIATNERNPKFFDLYRYSADDYSRTLVFENNDRFQLGDVSRDGSKLAMRQSATRGDANVFVVDIASTGGEPKLLTPHDGAIAHSVMSFTPDGSSLIIGSDEGGEFRDAYQIDLTSGEKSVLAQVGWDIYGTGFSSTGKYRGVYANIDATTVVTITDTDSGKEVLFSGLPKGSIGGLRFNEDDTKAAFMVNSDTSPNDLYVADMTTGETKRMTSALSADIDESNLVTAEVIRYDSFDGVKIPSILYKPKGASAENKVPGLVLVHGGPGGQTRTGYRAFVQHLVNHGYAVLGANNRGSSGYGKTFYHMDDKRHGEEDLRDIVEGKGYLASLDWVDANKIGIIGGSYGGYITVAALTYHPDVFDVGVNIFGVTNWVRTLESIPPYWDAQPLYDEMGDPATDKERLHRISPLFHTQHIKKPMLVVQGANDPRVLQIESDEIVEAVKARGVPVEYHVYEGEGHGFRKRENRIHASNAYVSFLDKYLKGGE